MESPPVVSEFENRPEGDKTVSTKSPEPSERDESFTVYRTSLSDQATVDDALGFTPYVTAIALFFIYFKLRSLKVLFCRLLSRLVKLRKLNVILGRVNEFL